MQDLISPTSLPLQIDNGNIPYLNETAKWAKFLAILGFIFCALMLIIGILAATALSSIFDKMPATNTYGSSMFAFGGVFIGAIYIILGAIYFLPCIFLFNFASKMQAALRNNDQFNLNTSFKNLKSLFKFWGILTVIILCIYAIIIVVSIVASIGLNR